jgi:hypothetical protein
MLSALYARASSSGNDGDVDRASLEQLERMIAGGSTSTQTWAAYGKRLFENKQFSRSALAYGRVIEIEPYNRPARLQCALALAGTGEADPLLAYLRTQLYVEPKLVAELLDHGDLQRYRSDARFVALQKEARAQAMD